MISLEGKKNDRAEITLFDSALRDDSSKLLACVRCDEMRLKEWPHMRA